MKIKLIKKFNELFVFITIDKNQKRLKKINLLFSIVCLFFIYQIFLEYNQNSQVNFKFSFFEIALVALSYLFGGSLWSKYMKQNYSGNFSEYFYNWSFSKTGKFIPSGIMTLSVRLNQKFDKGKSSKKIVIGVIEEQFLFPAVQILAICICFIFNSYLNSYILFFISTIFSFYFVKTIYFKLRNNPNSILDFPPLFICSILFQYLSLIYVAEVLGYQNPSQLVLFYFLSSSLGLFFVGVPAGIGIREVIFFTITNNFMGNIVLFEYIVKIRIIFFITDLIFGFIGFLKIYFTDRN